jgi:hypothetical protein
MIEVTAVISDEERILIYNLWHSIHRSLSRSFEGINETKDMVDRLAYSFENIKGIDKGIESALAIGLQKTKNALSKENIDKAIDAFHDITIILQTSLHFRLDLYDTTDHTY